MLYIINEWYGMPPSLPVIFSFLAFVALGVYAGTAIKSGRIRALLMVGLVLIYLICSPISIYDFLGIGVYTTFVGGVATLVLLGSVIGIIIGAIKKAGKK